MQEMQLLSSVVKTLDDKKAVDIKIIRVRDLTIIADYFVIASGSSSTQVKMLADEVEHVLSQQGVEPHHIEGRSTGWILLDYGHVVVHVLHHETREFYNLERLWNDGERLDYQQFLEGGKEN